jgi:[protein-PII] uridylyltransferase
VLDDREVRAFAESMPPRYREIFDDDAIRAHATIATARNEMRATTRVEAWRELPNGGLAICVVADDRPGLLSRISAALIVHDMDVVCAQAYGRTRLDGCSEAIDLFWLRPLSRARHRELDAADVMRMGEVLDALVRTDGDLGARLCLATPSRGRRSGRGTRVRFDRGKSGEPQILAIETDDRPGLLLAVCTALLRMRIQITSSDVRTVDGRACDEFHLAELDGRPLAGPRQLEAQTQVLAAIEMLWDGEG